MSYIYELRKRPRHADANSVENKASPYAKMRSILQPVYNRIRITNAISVVRPTYMIQSVISPFAVA